VLRVLDRFADDLRVVLLFAAAMLYPLSMQLRTPSA
jgi:hypothetical protein